jgi:tRNA(Ile2) C34 agmatinyltransferase TiaS
VPRPPRSGALPASWGPRYAVCPGCRDRARLAGPSATMRCNKCGGVFEIGWEDAGL